MTAIDDLDVSFAVPEDADGLLEVISDPTKMGEIQSKHGWDGITKFNAAYQEAAAKADGGKAKAELDEQQLAQIEARTHEILAENGMGMEGRLNLTPEALQATLDAAARESGAHYSKTAPGAQIDRANIFANTGEALASVFAGENPTKATGLPNFAELATKAAKARDISMAYSSHIGPSGGFLMPEAFRQDLLQIAHEDGVVRPRATIIPMSTPKVTIPAIHETNRSSTLFGGVQIYWTAEDAASQASEAAFKTISLEPDTMTGYAEIPNETMMDTIAFSAYFDAVFPKAMAFEEDEAFVQGSGVDRPLGFLNSPAVVEVAAEAAQDADTIVYENVLEMWARLPSSSMNRAVWLANQDTIRELGTMALSVGTGGAPIWLMNAQPGMPPTLMGRPIFYSEKMNSLGDAGDLALVDLSFYLIGDLQTVTVSSSEHYKFKDRMTAFSIVERVDGQPWVESAITPRRGANQLSPFVTLAARA